MAEPGDGRVDPLAFGADLVALLDGVPDGLRERAAVALFSAAAAQLALSVGQRRAAGVAYCLADHMATEGVVRG